MARLLVFSMFNNKIIFLLVALLIIPFTQAVIFENQTRILEETSGSFIQFEQDTTADLFVSNDTSQQIELHNLSTFNSTYTNINATDFSFLQYFNIANKTGFWGNGSVIEITFPEDRKITISGNDDFTWALTIDTTLPFITIHNPLNITYNTTTVQLNVTANEIIDLWQFSLNGAGNISFIPNITIGGTDGLNQLIVWANDTSGNFNLSEVFYTLNLTGANIERNITRWDNKLTGPVAWLTSFGDWFGRFINAEKLILDDGSTVEDNSTCLKLSSPDGSTTLDLCNI